MLLVLVNIENNANLEYKSQNPNKSKGIERKRKMESNNSWILKKPQEGGLDQQALRFLQEALGASQEPQHKQLSSF